MLKSVQAHVNRMPSKRPDRDAIKAPCMVSLKHHETCVQGKGDITITNGAPGARKMITALEGPIKLKGDNIVDEITLKRGEWMLLEYTGYEWLELYRSRKPKGKQS